MEELSIALATIFLTRLIVGNATKFVTFYIGRMLRERQEKNEAEEARLEGDTNFFKEKSRAEKDYYLDDWDPMLGTLENYSQISIEFGFVTLFVAAFPLVSIDICVFVCILYINTIYTTYTILIAYCIHYTQNIQYITYTILYASYRPHYLLI